MKLRALAAALLTLAALTIPAPAHAVAPGFRTMIFGDSIVEGCCSTTADTRLGGVIRKDLAYPSIITKGQGGTGYLTAGRVAGRQSYQNRIGATLDANPNLNVLIIEGGVNDPTTDLAAFRAAVRRTYTITKQKAPRTHVYVLGPYSPNGTGNGSKITIIREEAAKAGFPFVNTTPWMLNAKANGWLWTDGFHPNARGHAVIGHKAATALRNLGAPR